MEVKVYTTKEVAEIFNVSEATIRREVERGNLESFKIGVENRFTMYHLEKYANVEKLGKTKKELDLEEEVKKLQRIIENRNKTISNIKDLLLKEAKQC